MQQVCVSCVYRRNSICTKSPGIANLAILSTCPIGNAFDTVRAPSLGAVIPCIAPIRRNGTIGVPWEGNKPWSRYSVTTIIPVLEWTPLLDTVIEALRLQSTPPLIVLVDTGSIETTDKLSSLRSIDLEVLSIRSQGWKHPSWPVAAALDTAWSIVSTEFVFLTHNDCVLKTQQHLQRCKISVSNTKLSAIKSPPEDTVAGRKSLGTHVLCCMSQHVIP